MAAVTAQSPRGRYHNEVFLSVFPKVNYTTPTPESTPQIGTIASPGLSSGGFASFDDAGSETAKYTRAWSSATRFLHLSSSADESLAQAGKDVLAAFAYLLGSHEGRQQVIAWYANEIGAHFRTVILPQLQIWREPIPLKRADKILGVTLDLLLNAKQYYLGRIDELLLVRQASSMKEVLAMFRRQTERSVHALVLHALPRQRLQQTLASVFYGHLDSSLRNLNRPDGCAQSAECHCKLDLSDAPLQQLHDVGLGGSIGERAFAHALHRFLQGPAIERRCFQVDWTRHQSVVPKLRTWISQHVSPLVDEPLVKLRGGNNTLQPSVETENLASIAIANLGRLRVSSLFDHVNAWPASTGAILDIWEYLNAGNQMDKAHVCQSFSEQINRRLLHAGASTAEILSIYVNVIHTFKALDGRGVLLEKVATPIRNYLRARDDTVSIIAASFLVDTDENGNVASVDSDKVCSDIAMVVASTALGGSREEHTLNWDDMEWMPDPIDAGPHYQSSKSEDVVAQILGLFDSEQFIKEITAVLAQHLLHSTDADYIKETRLVELLKSRLDIAKLQAVEVMLKDMRDSVTLGRRINPHANYDSATSVPTPKEIQAAIPEDGITLSSLHSIFEKRIKRTQFVAAVKLVANKRDDLLYPKRTRIPLNPGESPKNSATTKFDVKILSSYFWPELRSNSFSMPQHLQPLADNFKDRFYALGSQRRLEFRPALSRTSIRLELEDRVVEETDVAGWRASVIDVFADSEHYDKEYGMNLPDLKERLTMDEELVLDALTFWTAKSVLFQKSPGVYAVLERLDMDTGGAGPLAPQEVDEISAVKSDDALFRESAPVLEAFITNMLRNQGAKEVGGMMGIAGLLRMVLPSFTYGEEEVVWLLSEMEKRGVVRKKDGVGGLWEVV